MKINLVVHRQLKALDIYGEGINWQELCDSFVDGQEKGIYFFTYGNSNIPYYIGKSHDVINRVRIHLNTYANGGYWLSKNPDLLTDLECFKSDYKDEDMFFAPGTDPAQEGFKEAADKLLHNTLITFSYLQDEAGNRIPELINDVEFQLQANLVNKYNLAIRTVGDGGANFEKAKNKGYELQISYIVNPVVVEIDESILR